MRRIAYLAFAAAVCGFGAAASAQTAAQSAADTLPPGPALAVIKRACNACHDMHTITQHGHTPAEWAQIINRMLSNGTNVSDAEADQIQAYLTQALPPSGK